MNDLDTLARNLRILLRADIIIAQLHLQRMLKKSILYAVAFVIGGFGIVMLGVAGFLALEELYGRVVAALIMGGVGVVLALICLIVAGRVRSGDDMRLAQEVHGAALSAVSQNLKDTGANVTQFASLANNPLESILPGLLMQLFGIVMRRLRRRWSDRDKS
ncbi:phage holin family protein [Xanthobacter sp. TB0136]|uniref:phage holin family protein n=1 Tax=Xanthobacter sp. TB0136 TaxID=3459177 RepID=UPI004039F520